MSEDQLTLTESRLAPVEFASNGTLKLRTLEDVFRLAKAIHQSGLAPKSFGNEQAVLVAILMGTEVGLAPMQAIQSIAVINGSPKVWGATALALVRGSGLLESYDEEYQGEGETRVAIVKVKRKGENEHTYKFSVKDAKTAELWSKGTWRLYPDRMLLWRARGYALHDVFGDVLKGLRPAEIDDIPETDHENRLAHAKPAQVVASAPVAAPPAEETAERPRRGRPPKAKTEPDPAQYPDDGTLTPKSHPDPEAIVTAEELRAEIFRRLAHAGYTEEQLVAVVRNNKLPGGNSLAELPLETAKALADDWEEVLAQMGQLKSETPFR